MPKLDRDILQTLKDNARAADEADDRLAKDQPVKEAKDQPVKEEKDQPVKEEKDQPVKEAKEPKAPRIQAANKTKTQAEKIKDYKKSLEQLEITEDEANKIVDSLIFEGHYAEVFSLKDRVHFELKTRSAKDLEETQKLLKGVQNGAEYVDKLNRLNLSRSLVSYGERTFETPQQVLEFVDDLSVHVYGHMVNQLAKFDLKMDVVLSEGALENF